MHPSEVESSIHEIRRILSSKAYSEDVSRLTREIAQAEEQYRHGNANLSQVIEMLKEREERQTAVFEGEISDMKAQMQGLQAQIDELKKTTGLHARAIKLDGRYG